jgi:hypothetical protein
MVVHTCYPSYLGGIGGSQSEASSGKKSRPYLKNKVKQKRLEEGLKSRRACLASAIP